MTPENIESTSTEFAPITTPEVPAVLAAPEGRYVSPIAALILAKRLATPGALQKDLGVLMGYEWQPPTCVSAQSSIALWEGGYGPVNPNPEGVRILAGYLGIHRDVCERMIAEGKAGWTAWNTRQRMAKALAKCRVAWGVETEAPKAPKVKKVRAVRPEDVKVRAVCPKAPHEKKARRAKPGGMTDAAFARALSERMSAPANRLAEGRKPVWILTLVPSVTGWRLIWGNTQVGRRMSAFQLPRHVRDFALVDKDFRVMDEARSAMLTQYAKTGESPAGLIGVVLSGPPDYVRMTCEIAPPAYFRAVSI
jgi:hypothetical protein